KGPFLIERAMAYSVLTLLLFITLSLRLLAATLDDHRVGPLVLAGLEPLRELAPGRAGVAAARRAALAAPHGVVDRVHGDPSVVRPAPLPARAAGLADVHAGVLDVPDLADGGAAIEMHAAGLARGEPDLTPVPLLGHELGARPRRPAQLRPARDLELDVVD